MLNPSDRRVSPRCDAVPNRSCIEFASPQSRERIDGKLVNISRQGALVIAENSLPVDSPVWLRIDAPVKTDWVDAKIVRCDQNQHVGLHFAQGCPDDLLLAATIGIDLAFMIRGGINSSTFGD